MKNPRGIFETWAIIRACLEADAPMPHDVREYLLESARKLDELNELVRTGAISPQRAADSIPKRLGLSAAAYRGWLRARLNFVAANVYGHQVEHTGRKAEDVASDLAAQLGVSPRTIYRKARRQKER
jgi:hypothetical protein